MLCQYVVLHANRAPDTGALVPDVLTIRWKIENAKSYIISHYENKSGAKASQDFMGQLATRSFVEYVGPDGQATYRVQQCFVPTPTDATKTAPELTAEEWKEIEGESLEVRKHYIAYAREYTLDMLRDLWARYLADDSLSMQTELKEYLAVLQTKGNAPTKIELLAPLKWLPIGDVESLGF